MADFKNLSGVRVTVNLVDPSRDEVADNHSVEVGLSDHFLDDGKIGLKSLFWQLNRGSCLENSYEEAINDYG